MPPYPRWRYFPGFAAPPEWVAPLVNVFVQHRADIDSAVTHAERMQSDDVLRALADSLEALDYAVERGKKKMGKLPRPVYFGDEGSLVRNYEIDAFHADYGVALEVEAGRATLGNAIYRDLIQTSLIVDAGSWRSPCRWSIGTRTRASRCGSPATARRTPSRRPSTGASGSSSRSTGCC